MTDLRELAKALREAERDFGGWQPTHNMHWAEVIAIAAALEKGADAIDALEKQEEDRRRRRTT